MTNALEFTNVESLELPLSQGAKGPLTEPSDPQGGQRRVLPGRLGLCLILLPTSVWLLANGVLYLMGMASYVAWSHTTSGLIHNEYIVQPSHGPVAFYSLLMVPLTFVVGIGFVMQEGLRAGGKGRRDGWILLSSATWSHLLNFALLVDGQMARDTVLLWSWSYSYTVGDYPFPNWLILTLLVAVSNVSVGLFLLLQGSKIEKGRRGFWALAYCGIFLLIAGVAATVLALLTLEPPDSYGFGRPLPSFMPLVFLSFVLVPVIGLVIGAIALLRGHRGTPPSPVEF